MSLRFPFRSLALIGVSLAIAVEPAMASSDGSNSASVAARVAVAQPAIQEPDVGHRLAMTQLGFSGVDPDAVHQQWMNRMVRSCVQSGNRMIC